MKVIIVYFHFYIYLMDLQYKVAGLRILNSVPVVLNVEVELKQWTERATIPNQDITEPSVQDLLHTHVLVMTIHVQVYLLIL